jgi:hypothetical protein
MYLLSRQPPSLLFMLEKIRCISITPRILKLVDDSIKPHLEKVKQCQEAITHKEIENNKQKPSFGSPME